MPRFSLPEDVALSCFLRGLKAGIGDSLWCPDSHGSFSARSGTWCPRQQIGIDVADN